MAGGGEVVVEAQGLFEAGGGMGQGAGPAGTQAFVAQRFEAAQALARAQRALRRRRPDLSLKVYDAARPMSVQQRMWNVVAGTPKHIYVSNPRNGGGLHNYGLAVDITLCNERGDSLPMGTRIDFMGHEAHIDREEQLQRRGVLTPEAAANRRLLREVMAEGGFRPLRTEWWHFNLRSRAEARARYQVIR